VHVGSHPSVRIVAGVASCLLLVLLFASSADAALCVHLAVKPANPSVGLGQLELRTFVPMVDSKGAIQLSPEAVPAYPFQVVAIEPGGKRVSILVRPSVDDPELWVGP